MPSVRSTVSSFDPLALRAGLNAAIARHDAEEFIRAVEPLVRARVRSWSNVDEPDDLAQEVFVRMYEKRENIFSVAGDPLAVVQRVITNVLTDRYRRARRRPRAGPFRSLDAEEPGAEFDPSDPRADVEEAVMWAQYRHIDASELAIMRAELAVGQLDCVFHPPPKGDVCHDLVLSVLQAHGVQDDDEPDLAEAFKRYHSQIKKGAAVPNRKTLNEHHYRCLEWLVYRMCRSLKSPQREGVAKMLAARVQLEGGTARWNRQSCQMGAARWMWANCPDVCRFIRDYLREQVRTGCIGDDDRERLERDLSGKAGGEE